MKRLTLDLNEAAALASALDNYLNGIGMDDTLKFAERGW